MDLRLSGLENYEFLFTAAMILSGVAIVVLLWAVVNVWRRPTLPGISYGSISLSERRVRWIWTGILLGGLGLAAAEDPVVTRTTSMEDPEATGAAEAASEAHVGSSLQLPFPFYRYERQRTRGAEALLAESTLEGVIIPWALLSSFLTYLLLVVRWNPTNRWALRILHGRKRRRARAA